MFKLSTYAHLQDGSDTVCHGVDTLDSETQKVQLSIFACSAVALSVRSFTQALI